MIMPPLFHPHSTWNNSISNKPNYSVLIAYSVGVWSPTSPWRSSTLTACSTKVGPWPRKEICPWLGKGWTQTDYECVTLLFLHLILPVCAKPWVDLWSKMCVLPDKNFLQLHISVENLAKTKKKAKPTKLPSCRDTTVKFGVFYYVFAYVQIDVYNSFFHLVLYCKYIFMSIKRDFPCYTARLIHISYYFLIFSL